MDTCSICGAIYSGDHCPNCGWFNGPIRSRAAAITAGRAHARARGDRLTPTQIVRLAALIRPHLDEPRAETA